MKYAVLLLALMFAGCGGCSSTDGGYETFTIAGETMQVAKEDFPSTMNWADARKACESLGNGWRLPSREEQLVMYQQLHIEGKGKFKEDYYWSSSEYTSYEFNEAMAWLFNFGMGQASTSFSERNNEFRVRAVRALP